jgi:hypothetical protein
MDEAELIERLRDYMLAVEMHYESKGTQGVKKAGAICFVRWLSTGEFPDEAPGAWLLSQSA